MINRLIATAKIVSAATAGVAVFLVVGMVVTAVTVRDEVSPSPAMRNCIKGGRSNLDHPLERLGLVLGKIRVIKADYSSAEFEAYTIYRIPLGVLRGQPNARWGVNCLFVDPLPPDASMQTIID